MLTWLSDFGIFFREVFKRWVELVTGGVIAFAWLIYCQLTGKSLSMTVFCWILVVTLLFAVFGAWREQYLKAKGGLEGEINQLWWAKDQGLLFLQARIFNTGLPTVIPYWGLRAELSDKRQITATNQSIPLGQELGTGTHKTRINKIMYEESTVPVAQGGQIGGWLCFSFPVPREEVHRPDTTLVLEFRDVKGNKFFTKSPGTGTGSEMLYYPGTGSLIEEINT